MKKIITFSRNTAILERSKTAATLSIALSQANAIFPMPLAELADTMNEVDFINIHTIMPTFAKIAFTIDKETTNTELIDSICNAISSVFDTDTVVSNERAEAVV